MAVTPPPRLRGALQRLLVPNQVVLGRPEQRRDYETRTLDKPAPEDGSVS